MSTGEVPNLDPNTVSLAEQIRRLREAGEAVPQTLQTEFFASLTPANEELVEDLPPAAEDQAADETAEVEIIFDDATLAQRAIAKGARRTAAEREAIEAATLSAIERIQHSESDSDELRRAQTQLIKLYDRFIHNRAWRFYSSHPRRAGVDVDDLVQEGRLGLLRAAESHELGRGTLFLSYAGEFIHSKMDRHYKDMAFTIRQPIHMQEKLWDVDKLNRHRRNRGLPLLSPDEIAEAVGVDPSLSRNRKQTGTTVGDLEHLRLIGTNMGSLDTGYSPHNDAPGENSYVVDESNELESLTCERQTPVDESAIDAGLQAALAKALEPLMEREQAILQRRFGLDDGIPKTLEIVGHEFGVTRERIREIEQKAFSKLRHPIEADRLRDFLEEQ